MRLGALVPALSLLLTPCVSLVVAEERRGVPADSELYRAIAAQDAALFEAYNRCELAKLAAFFVEDLEFYHDKSGLMRSRQSLVEAVKNNICGKVRRELVPGTLEVYPLDNYGALEVGVHRFHHPARDDREPVGEAKFVHLWQRQEGGWSITRVISYDHNALEPGADSARRPVKR